LGPLCGFQAKKRNWIKKSGYSKAGLGCPSNIRRGGLPEEKKEKSLGLFIIVSAGEMSKKRRINAKTKVELSRQAMPEGYGNQRFGGEKEQTLQNTGKEREDRT